ncbi:S9 family peptidase [Acidipila rosea]|uniref:Dipeptidyl-peptidase IV n=1 Tax=Acidipila rosea TaxID=768535 RepID=A0A4R1L4K3_9BACT|nr:alpha/beta fold hydrolase [Acidipila rosea]TCK71970.1 dipeptidyl-peptidase IV [Acidipila rosea]
MHRSSLTVLALLATTFFAVPASHAEKNKPWTVQDIFGGESVTGEAPSGIQWSPDARRATFLTSDGDMMQIDATDGHVSKMISRVKLGSITNAALSEKDKDHRGRYDEKDFQWAPDARHILFDTNGQLWLYDTRVGAGIQVGNSLQGSGDDPKFSPNGQYISYLHDNNIYLLTPDGHTPPLLLTNSHSPSIMDGGIDWVYLEELNTRSNYYWSPDSKGILYLQMDETAVPRYPLVDWIPTHAAVDQQRYPQPGDPNPAVKVGVVGINGGKTFWLKIPLSAGNDYIPRFGWINARTAWVETLARDHKKMNIYFADVYTGDVKLALAQTDPKFFTLTYDVNFDVPGEFLITSWQDGYRHIYRYTFDASKPLSAPARPANQVESGDYEVFSIKSVDPAAKTIYYLSSEGDSREQQVWSVKLDGTDKHQLSTEPGVHEPVFAPHGGEYVDKASSMMSPPETSLCIEAKKCVPVWHSKAIHGHELIKPELLTLKAADGKTTLYATLTLPPHATAPASVPLIVNPYGGPGVGAERNHWGGNGYLFDVLLAEHGYAVLHVDNRGMAGRGRDFEQAAYHDFGAVQLADQLASIDQTLAQFPQLDKNRLGWWGWSWGGTFTLNAMTHSDRFKAGVSVAPVTDFRNYDSIYTERYLGLPADNPDVYRAASVQETAKALKGHLLLVHGTGDDNVHIENSIQFIQKLIDAQIPYDFQVYPRKTHSIAGPVARTHLYARILAQFETYLKVPQEQHP